MKLIRWFRARALEERGFAVPTALFMLLAATAIVSVGVVSSINVQHGTIRDQDSKSALPQAEAGVSQALLQFNRVAASSSNPCSPVSSTGPTGGWCPPVSGGFDDGIYTFQVRSQNGIVEVVSTGNVGGVTRRVYVRAASSAGQAVFANGTVLSQDGIQLDSNSETRANMLTNGNIVMNSNALVCGQANVGIGKQFVDNGHYFSDPNCTVPGQAGQTQIDLPPVNQGDAATVNDNGRFFALDPVSGNKGDVCWNGKLATGATSSNCGSRQLFVDKNSAVTLGGSKYSFCKLTMRSNTALYIKAGTVATIYFDSPEACGLSSPALQLDMDSNSRITSTAGSAVNVRLMFVGSTSTPPRQTKILLSSNTSVRGACEQNFIVYAPLTDIEMNSNSTFCGGLAGKSIHLDQNARVYTDNSVGTFVVPATAAHYAVTNFVECTGPAANPPNTGC